MLNVHKLVELAGEAMTRLQEEDPTLGSYRQAAAEAIEELPNDLGRKAENDLDLSESHRNILRQIRAGATMATAGRDLHLLALVLLLAACRADEAERSEKERLEKAEAAGRLAAFVGDT